MNTAAEYLKTITAERQGRRPYRVRLLIRGRWVRAGDIETAEATGAARAARMILAASPIPTAAGGYQGRKLSERIDR